VPDTSERSVKQVIVIRRDLGMRRGKEVAQGAHASAAWLARRLHRDSAQGNRTHAWYSGWFTEAECLWMKGSFTKVVCQVADEQALRDVAQDAMSNGVLCHMITDAGKTEFHGEPTLTALAVGPDYADVVDMVTSNLKLY